MFTGEAGRENCVSLRCEHFTDFTLYVSACSVGVGRGGGVGGEVVFTVIKPFPRRSLRYELGTLSVRERYFVRGL